MNTNLTDGFEVVFEEGKYREIRNKKTHIHQVLLDDEWKNLTGVSEAVKHISNFGQAAYYGSRRALMELGFDPKAPKLPLDNVKRNLAYLGACTDDDLVAGLLEAYKAHSVYAGERAKKGTSSHENLEKYIKLCIEENEGKPLKSEDVQIKKFLDMTKRFEPRFISSEKHGYNEELFIGGITDLIVETNEGLGLWDFKDRAYVGDKDLIQTGGYAHLFPVEFTHSMVIPLEGEEVRTYWSVKELKEIFVGALQVHRFIKAQEK